MCRSDVKPFPSRVGGVANEGERAYIVMVVPHQETVSSVCLWLLGYYAPGLFRRSFPVEMQSSSRKDKDLRVTCGRVYICAVK